MLLNTTIERLREDPTSLAFVRLLEDNEVALKLSDARVYYKFPLYKDEDNVVAAKLIVVSRHYGVFVVETTSARDKADINQILIIDRDLDVVFGQLHSRLTRHRSLRRDKKT